MPHSNGTETDDAGTVQIRIRTLPYVPAGTDVYINGTLHEADGKMICTADAPVGGDRFINGLLHTDNGVRYAVFAGPDTEWPEGFVSDSQGRQMMIGVAQTNFIRGIGRAANGAMAVNVVP